MLNPVVVIPGIKGTGLENFYPIGGEATWGGWEAVFGTKLADVALDESGEVDFSDEVVTRPTYPIAAAYKKLVRGLRGRLKVPVYVFPYDWRLSCRANGERLVEFVALLRKKPMKSVRGWATGDRLVSLVCHSMGGLVARSALRTWGERKQQAPIDHMAFVATPHHGSLDSIRAMVVGDTPLLDFSKELRKLARALPSVYELLPRFESALVNGKGEELDVYDIRNWQSNVVEVTDGLQDVTQARLTAARRFHEDLPLPFDSKLGIQGETLCIYGSKPDSTLVRVPVEPAMGKWKNVCRFDEAGFGAGDQVVPVQSAMLKDCRSVEVPYSQVDYWLGELPARFNFHAFICALDEVQTIIASFLKKPRASTRTIMPMNLALGLTTARPQEE